MRHAILNDQLVLLRVKQGQSLPCIADAESARWFRFATVMNFMVKYTQVKFRTRQFKDD